MIRNKFISGIAVAFVVAMGITSCSSNTTVSDPVAVQSQAPVQVAPPAEVAAPVAPEATASQKNALKKAESYISFMAFSHGGLIQQLEFDQFTAEDAVWAVDNLKVDWNEQAAKKAKSYLDTMAFSRGGLIQQLKFDKFTAEQAEYGVTQAGL